MTIKVYVFLVADIATKIRSITVHLLSFSKQLGLFISQLLPRIELLLNSKSSP